MKITRADARLLMVDLQKLHQQNPNSHVWFDTEDDSYHLKHKLDSLGQVEEVVCKHCKGLGECILDGKNDDGMWVATIEKCLTCDGTGRI